MPDPGPSIAILVADYYKCLVKEGLDQHEALELTAQYQAEVFDAQRGSSEAEA